MRLWRDFPFARSLFCHVYQGRSHVPASLFLLTRPHLVTECDNFRDEVFGFKRIERILRGILSIQRHRLYSVLRRYIVDADVGLRGDDVFVSEQFPDEKDVATFLIEPLRESFPQRVCGKFAVQPCRDKHIIEYLMNGLALNGGVAFARRKQRDIGMYAPEVGAMPRDDFLNRRASIGIHWDRPRRFTALDNRSVKLKIGDGLVVLIDIADGECEQFRDAPAR